MVSHNLGSTSFSKALKLVRSVIYLVITLWTTVRPELVTFSFIGLESVTVDIGSRSVIDVALSEDGSFQEDKLKFTFEDKRKVKGRILSEDGKPLPGIAVVVIGAEIGAITNTEGEYEISVPDENGFLMYSFVGLKSQFIKVGDKSVIDVVFKKISSDN